MRSEIESMTSKLSHRGPDGFGYASMSPEKSPSVSYGGNLPDIHSRVFFGHRRLAIIDIEGSKQPLFNEDGTVGIVFNGEIYNYLELADDLKAKGHILKSSGDTETLVHLWEQYGEDMLEHIVGMFAFAIYDSRRDLAFIARDRFGQKPLYYFKRGAAFFFASELQAFFGLKNFHSSKVYSPSIAQYFRYGFIPGPSTAYEGVFSLPAGNFMTIKNGVNTSIQRYWKPNVSGEISCPDLNKIESLLDESVKIRMRSDVPFGAFLSGGIDSGLVTASMAKQEGKRTRTFTVSTGKEYWEDESEAAADTAHHIDSEHHELKVTPDFISVSEMLAKHYGQPYADHSSVLTYYISRETRKFVKVALTGDGGDELFAGYNGYLKTSLYDILGIIPFHLRSTIGEILSGLQFKSARRDMRDAIQSAFPLPQKGENITSLFHRKWREEVFEDDFKKTISESIDSEIEKFTCYYNEASSKHPLDKWLEADQRLYLCDDILCKLDIASMSVSLECRSPFLDHRLAEYVNMISSSAKIAGGRSKAILRDLALRRLPQRTSRLQKKGFSMPLGKWMRKDLKGVMRSLIFDRKESWTPFLKYDAVKRMWDEHQSGEFDHHMRLWMIIMLGKSFQRK